MAVEIVLARMLAEPLAVGLAQKFPDYYLV